ncbi:MAG TPA: threonine/serine dehydratase [Candidatus Dormibacteraeota bacterium]|nr:threonine/serine dehydratase [Candidatus Dormibacteraeota bacterium]
MADRLVPIERIHAARERITGRVHRTPIFTSATAARLVEGATAARIGDGRLYVKAEHLQKTGSFKPRAALSKLTSLSSAERAAGVITLSAGNAAQAYAWAGSVEGVAVTVTMPAKAVRSKVDASRDYGAEVVLHGAHIGETLARLQELIDERGLTLVHPFDDPEVIAGNGSVGLEILEDLPDVDVVVAGVGGGGLISGVATALKEQRPGTRVYGVEPERSDAVSRAIKAGQVVRVEPASLADGLGAPFAGEWTLPICRTYLDDIVLLDDATILRGLRFAAERMKQVLEPAGAAALAAVIHGRIPIRAGERVCVIASGGNVEISRLGEFLEGAAGA